QNNPSADGIVVLHDYVGSIGTSAPYHSRTLTHEIGHWINLRHCWGNSNTPGDAANCDTDDNVDDTPNTIGWTNCVLSGATCGSPLDNVENYMEYSYCSKMFTEGQKARMLAALNSSTSQRNQLWSASNLTATGVSGAPVLCAAEFTNTANIVCVGSTVTFNDASYHGVTSRSWSFPGGSPATSTDSDPVVTYDQPGSYSVQLTVSDGFTTLTSTQNTQIVVMDNPGATPPVQEGFESITNLNGPEWYSVNPDADNTFTVSGSAAYSGSKCSRILNSSAMTGLGDELLSRSVDMSQAGGIVLSFRYAYARRNSTSDDVLSVYVSNNCGATWSLRKIMRGTTTLPTAPISTGNFVPNGQGQWGYAEVVNISEAYHVPD
ncbi:MAG TPA: M43 family zinc metalloprotease, partial [Flavobacteriales bacterium]|nr:M43 family zinc metalloprotease [Flavobacteriales bacterium]